MIRFITRHVRGKRCTASQLALTRLRLRAVMRLCACLAGACILALEAWAIVHLLFSL